MHFEWILSSSNFIEAYAVVLLPICGGKHDMQMHGHKHMYVYDSFV